MPRNLRQCPSPSSAHEHLGSGQYATAHVVEHRGELLLELEIPCFAASRSQADSACIVLLASSSARMTVAESTPRSDSIASAASRSSHGEHQSPSYSAAKPSQRKLVRSE